MISLQDVEKSEVESADEVRLFYILSTSISILKYQILVENVNSLNMPQDFI